MTKRLLLALTIVICLTSFVLSDEVKQVSSVTTTSIKFTPSKNIKCQKTTDIEDCYDLDYKPTCAYYKKDCPLEICGRDVGNSCYACSENTTEYYRNGACKEDEVVAQCYEDMCNEFYDANVKNLFEPVCAIKKGGKKKTFSNNCKSCSSDWDWYNLGPCKKDRHVCKNRNKDCSKAAYKPVCAHARVADNTTQFVTAPSGCNACNDKSVEYWIEGECGQLSQNSTYCLPNSRPSFCTMEYNPVCAFYLDDNNVLKHEIAGNGCGACASPNVIYHQPGPCVFKCNRSPGIIFECDGTTTQPICGTYEQNGKEVKVSLKNECIGCYYAPGPKIDSYVDGLCPGDEGIYCKNDAGGFLQGVIAPVCGVTVEGCDESSCQTSFSEPMFACADNSTLLFKPGYCPGDEGLSCRPFREGFTNDDNTSYLAGINYGDVCGYTQAGCSADSCRQTYANQTVACADDDVLYFKKGAC